MKRSVGVFSWNVAKLCAHVSELEKNGDRVVGYEVGKLDGYPFEQHDRLVFLEYSPDLLSAWKAKGDTGEAEIVIPEEPRKFGGPIPVDPPSADETASNPARKSKHRKAELISIEE